MSTRTGRLSEAVEEAARELRGGDLEFYRRVWQTDPAIYRTRIKAIGFTQAGRILDAGCGMGQWSMSLAEANQQVEAVDVSDERLRAAKVIFGEMGVSNVNFSRQSVARLEYPDETFDAVFCYSVLCMVDHRAPLREFARVLKPGGRLYLSSNGLGWYVYNLLHARRKSAHYDPRRMAFDALVNSLAFYSAGRHTPGKQLIVPGKIMQRTLRSLGFDRTIKSGEGTITVSDGVRPAGFYLPTYYGMEGVYEILAWKGKRA